MYRNTSFFIVFFLSANRTSVKYCFYYFGNVTSKHYCYWPSQSFIGLYIKTFHTTGLFLYPLRTSENLWYLIISEGIEETSGMTWVMDNIFRPRLTHLFPMHPFSTPSKHQKTLWFFLCFDVFRVLEKGCIGNEWVNETVSPRLKVFPAQFNLESECVCVCHVTMHWLNFLKYSILS